MPKSSVNARFGWKVDKPDIRDKYYQLPAFARLRAIVLPSKMSLKGDLPPVYDQGNLGSCTANAIAGSLQFDQQRQQAQQFMPSRLFIYYGERELEGTVYEDSGAEIRDGIKIVNGLGCCSEKVWPYNITKFARKPSKRAYTLAGYHQALTYRRVEQSLTAFKTVLAEARYPIIFGFTCYASLEQEIVDQTGVVPMPGSGEEVIGGHAVLATGYDDASRTVEFRNSWGAGWGLNGYGTLPYDYILDRNLADDFWIIETIEVTK